MDMVFIVLLTANAWSTIFLFIKFLRISQRADLAVADLTITERREKVVDFTIPYMFTTEDVILKKSSSGETVDYLQFTNPLHSEVWFAMLATLLVVSVAVFILNYFSPFGYKDDNELGTSQEFSFFNSMWFSLACMLQQGAENQPRNLSGTGKLIFLLFLSLMIMMMTVIPEFCYRYYHHHHFHCQHPRHHHLHHDHITITTIRISDFYQYH